MRNTKRTNPTKHERNPDGVMHQCTASAGKGVGRCRNESTTRYAQRHVLPSGDKLVWMNRCDAHPMPNAAAVEPITADDTMTRKVECQPR